MAETPVPTQGLIVYRASRLEALLAPLGTLLKAVPPGDTLAPSELLTAHPGMRRWLLNNLADYAGSRGIAANIEVDLPGQWIDRLCRRALPQLSAAAPRYATEALRWRLFALLEQPARTLPDAPSLDAYLAEGEADARRWPLAGALAEVIGRLLVYRPDWLEAWSRGGVPIPDAEDVAAVWRALRSDIGQPHRSESQPALLHAAAAATRDAPPLHVFGISHLPPRQLDVLRAVSRQRLVVMYVPDPCVEHWAGLGSERQRLRSLLDSAPGVERDLLHLDTGHPLLASLGRLGQQFGALLAASDQDVVIDIRHSLDASPGAGGRRHLLGRLQDSIRQLAPDALAARPDDDAVEGEQDASLRVHRCHSRWRELEVLRDALLQALHDLPDLRPAQIAVLAPSMADYAPLLGAVFGPPADSGSPLPYHVADLPVARNHPLHAAWLGLIEQGQRRSTAPDLMALLRQPAVQRALALDASDIESLQHGLGASAAAMGLDAEARADEGLPALEPHTLAWGLDRLCLGYALGDEEDEPALMDGLRPAGAPGEGDVRALGGLHRLLSAIGRLRREAHEVRRASRWIDLFMALWRGLFRVDPMERDEVEAEDALLEALADAQRSLQDADCDPDMRFEQALAMLKDQLGRLGDRGHYLHGGITFCGMVPQRALPFRMICVLGLEEGAFPRRPASLQLDPLPRHPRVGDRDVLSDDRYLFLETLMSARTRLHLSWVGEDARDGSERLPSPVLSELLEVLAAHAGTPGRPWRIDHPLQPFDSRYARDPDARQPLRSWGPLWRPPRSPAPASGAAPDPSEEPPTLDGLRGWLRNPAQELLRQRWRMPLRGLDATTLPSDEPLDTRIDARQALWRELLHEALAARRPPPTRPDTLLMASGRLAPGRPGALAYAREHRTAEALFARASRLSAFSDGSEALAYPVALQLPSGRLTGRVAARRVGDQIWLIDFCRSKAAFSALAGQLDLLLRVAVLALREPEGAGVQVVRLAPEGDDDWAASLSIDAAAAAQRRAGFEHIVSSLLDIWRQALSRPLAYFPKTTEAWVKDKDAEAAWLGGDYAQGERDWHPGYGWLLAGDERFWQADQPAHAAFVETAHRLTALLAEGHGT